MTARLCAVDRANAFKFYYSWGLSEPVFVIETGVGWNGNIAAGPGRAVAGDAARGATHIQLEVDYLPPYGDPEVNIAGETATYLVVGGLLVELSDRLGQPKRTPVRSDGVATGGSIGRTESLLESRPVERRRR